MAELAIDGGEPVWDVRWPAWPPPLDPGQRHAVLDVLETGRWGATPGGVADSFAKEFADAHAVAHGIPVANGTMALFVALSALGVGPGDEVVVPAYTFVACATSVLLTGATPVIADVSSMHLHLTAETIEPALSDRTRAIMVVHLAGSPAPMSEIVRLARHHGIRVVEDAAQAHGAAYRGTRVGGIGDLSTFSFQSSKAMTAGEGGAVLTNDDALADRAWSIANVGRTRGGEWYGHASIGWNLRLTEIQAALLRPWLPRLDAEIATRAAFATTLAEKLSAVRAPLQAMSAPSGTSTDSRHLLMLELNGQSPDRDWIATALGAEGLPVDLGYPGLQTMDAVARRSRIVETPNLDSVSDRVLWIRQPVMMSGREGAEPAANAIHRVLSDPRAFPST